MAAAIKFFTGLVSRNPHSEEMDPGVLKEFKKNLHKVTWGSSAPKPLPQIALELSQIIPKALGLDRVIDIVFEECYKTEILPLLNAIPLINPQYVFAPCDQLRKAIAEDDQHRLNNQWLNEKLKESGLDIDTGEADACFDLAYRLNHPCIYRPSRTPVPTSDYTLNFLWVNLDPQDRVRDAALNIFGPGLDPAENDERIKDPKSLRRLEEIGMSLQGDALEKWEATKKSFAYRISRWTDALPGAQMNLWYDSALVTQRAQQNTLAMMRDLSQSRGVDLRLRDIRRLPNVPDEIKHSLHPGTQIYFRVDILKALIADHMISSQEENAKYCVVSDIDVEPMNPQQLFDQRTKDYLASCGYVFNRAGLGDFENSFSIFNKENEPLRRIHRETIIEATAAGIAFLREHAINTYLQSEYVLGAQYVFRRYSDFRSDIKDKRNKGPRKVVKCPSSQFNFAGFFPDRDPRAETFRFIGASNVPYTRKGRNFHAHHTEEHQIDALVDWKPEPLGES